MRWLLLLLVLLVTSGGISPKMGPIIDHYKFGGGSPPPPPPPPAPSGVLFFTGFYEQNTFTTSFGSSGHQTWSSSAGSPAIVTTPARYAGAMALNINTTAAAENVQIFWSPIAGSSRQIGSYYLRMEDLPAATSQVWFVSDGAANSAIFKVTSGGVLQAFIGSTSQNGPTLSADTWYRVDYDFNLSGNPRLLSWQVDGSAQTQVSVAVAASTISTLYLGTTASDTVNAYISDPVISNTSGDYPIGAHKTEQLLPNGDGTHNLSADITGDAGETTNLYLKVDEAWPPNTTDYVLQANVDTAAYAQFTFANTNFTDVWALRLDAALFAAATQTLSGEVWAKDGTAAYTAVHTGTIGATSLRYKYEIIGAPGGTWVPSEVNDMLAEFGFSGDATPDPYVSALAYTVLGPQ